MGIADEGRVVSLRPTIFSRKSYNRRQRLHAVPLSAWVNIRSRRKVRFGSMVLKKGS